MMDIAAELGVVEGTKEWIDMQRGSLLHDVGKIGVSDNILLKPGKLTDEEWSRCVSTRRSATTCCSR